jgi:hypothetical protein
MSKLVDTLDAVVNGSIAIDNACKTATEVTRGRLITVHGIKQRVHSSTAEMVSELEALHQVMGAAPASDMRRWAGVMLMAHAQLGAGNLDGVLEMIETMIRATGGKCPPQARPFVAAMIDAAIASLPAHRASRSNSLTRARRLFMGMPES